MKVLIIYSSLTGNTKMIAESIHGTIVGSELFDINNAPPPDGYDLIMPGFWVDKGFADAKALKYMENIKNKKVAPFFTLGAYPDSEHADKVFEQTKKMLSDNGNEVLGHFRCQGKVNPILLERMKTMPDNPHVDTPERRARLAEAAKHPNEEDCAAAAGFAASMAQLL